MKDILSLISNTGIINTGHLRSFTRRLLLCGAVRGDINAGGIAGSMAVEYDFDPEDDLVREGDSSSDFRLQTRAMIISCLNSGEITGKKDYAGGITGSADLGRISSCENYGSVTSTDGDYVGGIAGASQGSIDSCWSKCSLAGGDYVGGTAGLATELNNCHTLVTISEGTAYLGSVAGFAAEDATLSGNTFTGSLGAVDGISYEGKAAPVDFDTLCMTAGVPDLFSRLELTFTADGDTVAVVSLQYGEGVESLPEIPAKKGYSARWPDIDYTCITASQTLEAVYTPYSSALTDGGELPDILVDGSFSSSASVTHTEEEVTWTDENGVLRSGTAFTVTVKDPDLEQTSYTVHCRLPDSGKRYILWVLEDGDWTQQEYEKDGRYLLLDSQSEEITFCITERTLSTGEILAAAFFLILLLAAAAFVFLRFRRSKKTASPPKEDA